MLRGELVRQRVGAQVRQAGRQLVGRQQVQEAEPEVEPVQVAAVVQPQDHLEAAVRLLRLRAVPDAGAQHDVVEQALPGAEVSDQELAAAAEAVQPGARQGEGKILPAR